MISRLHFIYMTIRLEIEAQYISAFQNVRLWHTLVPSSCKIIDAEYRSVTVLIKINTYHVRSLKYSGIKHAKVKTIAD